MSPMPKKPEKPHVLYTIRWTILRMTQPAFGRLVGVSGAYIKKIESGKRPLSYDIALRISLATGASLDELMKGKDGKPLATYGAPADEIWLKHLGGKLEELPKGKNGRPVFPFINPFKWSPKFEDYLRDEMTGEDGKPLMYRGKPLLKFWREVWERAKPELDAGPPERLFTREIHEQYIRFNSLADLEVLGHDEKASPNFSENATLNSTALLNKLVLSHHIYTHLGASYSWIWILPTPNQN